MRSLFLSITATFLPVLAALTAIPTLALSIDLGNKIESVAMASGTHQSLYAGELVNAGKDINNGSEITTVINGQVEAHLIKVNAEQLPVNFDNAFVHLKPLSNELKTAPALGRTESKWSSLIFTPISIWLFVLAMALVYVNRKPLLAKRIKITKKPVIA